MAEEKLFTHLVSDFMQVLYFPGRFPHSLNQELLDLYRSYQPSLSCVLFTASPIHRFPDLLSQLEGVFDPILTVEEVGWSKTQPEAYDWVVQQLKVPAQQIIFVDDSADNIQAASKMGLEAVPFTSNESVRRQLSSLLQTEQ